MARSDRRETGDRVERSTAHLDVLMGQALFGQGVGVFFDSSEGNHASESTADDPCVVHSPELLQLKSAVTQPLQRFFSVVNVSVWRGVRFSIWGGVFDGQHFHVERNVGLDLPPFSEPKRDAGLKPIQENALVVFVGNDFKRWVFAMYRADFWAVGVVGKLHFGGRHNRVDPDGPL